MLIFTGNRFGVTVKVPRLVGMRSQADIARNYPEDRVGELVEFISY